MKGEKPIHEENSRTALAEYGQEKSSNKTLLQFLAAIFATFAAFCAGTTLSWSSSAIPLLHSKDIIPHVTLEEMSWISALITLGALTGAIPAGFIANIIGRKRILQILALPMFMSWLTIAFCTNVYGMMFARFLAGIAVGAYSVAIPMYVAEIAEPKIRGTLGTFFQLQITAGILFEYIVGLSADFKLIAVMPALLPVLFLMTFSFMPESPVHLSSKGQVEEARVSLLWLRGATYDTDDELQRIQEQTEVAKSQHASLMDLVTNWATVRALIISLGLMFFQQFSGINAIIFYTEYIFATAGVGSILHVAPIIIGVVMVIATYVSTILIDRAGRRILLVISSTVMSICLGCLALFFYIPENVGVPGAVPLLSVAVYVTVFSLGYGPIPWMMVGELFPSSTKGLASSLAASLNWLLAFTVTKLFPDMIFYFGTTLTFTIFSAICALGTIFVIVLVPETKGKSVHEIQFILAGKSAASKQIYSINDSINSEIKV